MYKDLKFYKKVAKELRKRLSSCTAATSVKIVVDENGIDILPAKTNDTGAFYHTEVIIDCCRFWGLSNFVDSYNGKTRVHIY